MTYLRFLAAPTALALALSACAGKGGSARPGASPYDGSYVGVGQAVDSPRRCGDGTSESMRLQVRGGVASINITSVALQGPVGPDGDLSRLRWTGRAPLEGASASGRIVGDAFTLVYRQDGCTWRFEGRRR